MCLIVFAYQQHPRYPLIVAANRDEFYDRPTRAAQYWDDAPALFAGKDLKSGGTWMGINRSGQFSALTNYRDPEIKKENPPSRGELVRDYLTNHPKPQPYLQQLQARADRYMGFNLLVGSAEGIGHYANISNKITPVQPGVHGLSNALLDTPWPKVSHAKQRLTALINEDAITEDRLFGLLTDAEPTPDHALPKTGVGAKMERQLSPAFITMDGYGTRCSTVLTISAGGEMQFTERRYRPGSQIIAGESRIKISI